MKTIDCTQSSQHLVTDETLVHLVLSGQENAFTLLVRRYESLLHSILRHYLPDHGARQEVIQDTFLRAFNALQGFRFESKFSTWLSRIARTTALNRMQLKRHAAWQDIDDTLSQWESDLNANQLQLEKQEASQLLLSAVYKLPPNDALSLELFYFREQSIEEIGQATGWTIPNVKTRLSRARQRLHAVLVEEGLAAEYFA